MTENWLLTRMQLLGIGATELSRRLEDQGVPVSRQTIENWCKMPNDRLPIHVNNPALVEAIVVALEYTKVTELLYELGYKVEPGPLMSPHFTPLLRKLESLKPEDQEPLGHLIWQILEKWRDVHKYMGKS